MHREISHADSSFAQESRLSLYLLTALLGLLIGIDLWPALASWALGQGFSLPTWPREILGWRVALIAAILGGVLWGARAKEGDAKRAAVRSAYINGRITLEQARDRVGDEVDSWRK